MSAEIVPAVLAVLKLHGYRTAHFRTALTQRGAWITPVSGDGKGFPDIIAVGNGRILAIEVKGAKGYLRPEQRAWRDDLMDAGVEFLVIRPQNLQVLRTLCNPNPKSEENYT